MAKTFHNVRNTTKTVIMVEIQHPTTIKPRDILENVHDHVFNELRNVWGGTIEDAENTVCTFLERAGR